MILSRPARPALGGLAKVVRSAGTRDALLRCHGVRFESSVTTRQWSTPLAKTLAGAITTTGPISLAAYMRQCLTAPEGGYYTTRTTEGTDQFGKAGDFVTSPEISQIFGELVGVWFVAEWMQQGRKSSGIQMMELGPGRGTLMDDVLRTIANFKDMAAAIDTIYLVEASPILRESQRQLLCGDSPMQDHPVGQQSDCKRIPGAKVIWAEDVKFIPRDAAKTPFIIAHEFFDALPIYAFQSAQVPVPNPRARAGLVPPPITPDTPVPAPALHNEWRELLVSPTAPPSVLNPPKTPGPEFELTLSKQHTHHSRLLPTLSPRYAALLPSTGSTIEISPESQTTVTYLTELISGGTSKPAPPPPAEVARAVRPRQVPAPSSKSSPSGAALFIDYGPSSTIPISTLRGIRAHKLASPFSDAGLVDLSADVDFGALVEAALEASEKVEVHGPVGQGDWLEGMGGRERCEMLVKKAKAGGKEGEEVAQRIRTGWERLVGRGPDGMGKLYKVMAVVPERNGARPVGFGGDV